MVNELGINVKSKIGQWLCKHKNTKWFREKEDGPYLVISGYSERKVCMDCGKHLDKTFTRYD